MSTFGWDPVGAIRMRPVGGTWRPPFEALRGRDPSRECVDVAVYWDLSRPNVSVADALQRVTPMLRRALSGVQQVSELVADASCPEFWLGVLDIMATLGQLPRCVVFRTGPFHVPSLYHPPGAHAEVGTPLVFPGVCAVRAATCLDATDPTLVHLLNYFPAARILYDEFYAHTASDLAILAHSGRVSARTVIFDPTADLGACDALVGMLGEPTAPERPPSSMRAFLANIANVHWAFDSTKPSDAARTSAASMGAAARALVASLSPSCRFTVQFTRAQDLQYIVALSPCVTDVIIGDSVPDAMYMCQSALRIPVDVLCDMPAIARIRFINSAAHAAGVQELQQRFAWAPDVRVTIGGIDVSVPRGPGKAEFMARLHETLDFTSRPRSPLRALARPPGDDKALLDLSL